MTIHDEYGPADSRHSKARSPSSEQRPIVLVHTPKCAGKSLREALREVYGDSLCLQYSNPLKLGKVRRRLQTIRGKIGAHRDIAHCRCVYGHFSLDRYGSAILARRVCSGMFFRQPLDLLVSYYFYHATKHAYRSESDAVQKAGILALAQQSNMRWFYRRFLGGFQPHHLDYVGLFEVPDESLQLYRQLFGESLSIGRRNVTASRPADAERYLSELEIYDRVTELLSDNIELYHAAKRRFDVLRGESDPMPKAECR